MNGPSWVRVDLDFSSPAVIFKEPIRTPWLLEMFRNIKTPEDVAKAAAVVEAKIGELRPELKNGTVHAIYLGWGMEIEIYFTHRSLPRIKNGQKPPTQRIELCPICKNTMNPDGMLYLGIIEEPAFSSNHYRTVELCSEECLKKSHQPVLPCGIKGGRS